MAIIRLYTGDDGKSHFETVEPKLDLGPPSEDGTIWPQDAIGEVPNTGGAVMRRFDPGRSNPWHYAPGRVAMFNLTGSVEIEVGDGTKVVIAPGDILIAEDTTGQGHYTREVGPEARLAVFVPLGPDGA